MGSWAVARRGRRRHWVQSKRGKKKKIGSWGRDNGSASEVVEAVGVGVQEYGD